MLPQPSPDRTMAAVSESDSRFRARAPLLKAVVAQGGALLLMFAIATLGPSPVGSGSVVLWWAFAQGILAAGLGRVLGMESWWLVIHALFVPGLVWMLGLALSPLYALGALGLLVAVYGGVSRTRVPLFLSRRSAARTIADLLPGERRFTFVDLGCGLGGVLGSLARVRPAGHYTGIEAAPVPFLLSRLRAALGARTCRILWGDLWALDLGPYDVVYAYLSPAAMPRLWEKARREMRAGSLLISNDFSIPGVVPDRTIAAGASGASRLLLWRM